MKIGMRTPSIKKSISARTTGKAKRKIKRLTNPFYGKKGVGFIKNPAKSIKGKIYRKTTFSAKKAGGCLFSLIWYPMVAIFYLIVFGAIIMWWIVKLFVIALVWAFIAIVNGCIWVAEKLINMNNKQEDVEAISYESAE